MRRVPFFTVAVFISIFFLTTGKLPAQSPDKNKIEFLIKKADSIKRDHSNKSMEIVNMAINLAQESDFPMLEAKGNLIIADILFYQGNFEFASQYTHRALKIFRDLDMKKEAAETLNFLGLINAESLLYEPAFEYVEEAILINDQLNDSNAILDSYFNYAYVFERSNSPNIALNYYHFVDSLNKDPERKIKIIEGIASIYEDLGRYEEARTKYTEVLNATEDDVLLKIYTLNNIGDTYQKSGEYELSIPYYEQSLHIAEELNLLRNQEQNHIDLYKVYKGLGDEEKALVHLEKHTNIYKQMFSENASNQIAQMNSLYETERKNNLIALEKSKTRIRTIQRNALIVGFVIMSFAGIYFFQLYKKVHRINAELSKKTEKIENQNKELSKQKKEIEETQALLIQSEKMASIGTFTAGIAHEINNPLNFIAGGVTMIGQALKNGSELDPEELERAHKQINEGYNRSRNIIRTLINFSYPSAMRSSSKLQLLMINEVINNTLLLVSGSIPSNITIKRKLNASQLFEGYADKMNQVFLNIISNAIDEIKNNNSMEEIRISTKDRRVNHERFVVIEIENTGSHISEDNLPKLFDPFFTTKDQGKGTGLGLWISYTHVREQNGSIIAKNSKEGVKFIIEMPAVENI